ncbi:glutathione S-transferase family protein [Pseudochrobactrum sp. MP213Fo]|uniref:glutathione S-transferase family protein n=1 Tax=Pseudochrobactrum sp. MP213Fo TaxID=3022250 RepID=UPI003BA39353
MSKITLLYAAASPYARKALIIAHERGIADHIQLVDTLPIPTRPDARILAYNPSGKAPCAILSDGQPLYDSRVISLYFDRIGGTGETVYPKDQSEFAVLTLEALGDSMLDAALTCRYETHLRPENLRWQDWVDAQLAKIKAGLDDLEQRWLVLMKQGFHAGSIAVAAMLAYLDFRYADLAWRASHPALGTWFSEIENRPSMLATTA